jgi:molybdopterin synthase catalytic subunit
VQHKLGDCPISDVSVLIAVSSPHRTESLKAVEFAINELKKTVPIWKKVCNNYECTHDVELQVLSSLNLSVTLFVFVIDF